MQDSRLPYPAAQAVAQTNEPAIYQDANQDAKDSPEQRSTEISGSPSVASQDPREREIRRQFLDEAQAYVADLEGAVLGLAGSRIDFQKINEALRASHSIKGGAAMMGYDCLSEFAHRLEDSFKVLKTKRQSLVIDTELENQLLGGVDCLQRVIQLTRQAQPLDSQWLEQVAHPLFDQLRLELGEPDEENAVSVLGGDDGSQELLSLIFSSEVEAVLQQLEGLLQNPAEADLRSELMTLAGELGGLGEMLQLGAFTGLCESVLEAIDRCPVAQPPLEMEAIAQAALSTWRQAQALVLTHQLDLIPNALPDLAVGWEPEREPAAVPLPPPTAAPPVSELETQAAQNVAAAIAEFEADALATAAFEPIPLDPVPAPAPVPAAASPSSGDESQPQDLDRTVRVSLRHIERLNDLFGELTIERNALALYCDRLRSLTQLLKQRVKTLDHTNRELRTSYDELAGGGKRPSPSGAGGSSWLNSQRPTAEHSNGFDRLELDQYNSLSLQSQSVIENIVQLQEVTTDIDLSLEESDQTLRNLNKTSKHLRNQLTHLRMRPLADVLDRFPRALRDLGREHGKRVTLELEGSDTLVDRSVLEALQEPLMHLLRNAFDHGLEPAEERLAQGKPAEGKITIRASQRGNRTWVEFQDDGRGIDLDRVRQKAETLGLDPELLASASEQELLSLIFEPGFSTRDRVTALSGRGVGMDVVRERLKPVRGEIAVTTQPGQGTTFSLSVPFSLAVLRVLVVESQGMLLAIPADSVTEVVLLRSAGQAEWVQQRIRLGDRFSFNCPRPPYSLESNPKIDSPALLKVSLEERSFALEIERSWGEQEVAVRRVEGLIGLPSSFSNCTIMGDGRVIPLVNLQSLLPLAGTADASAAMSGASGLPDLLQDLSDRAAELPTEPYSDPAGGAEILPFAPPSKPAVLVVDDSINVRRFLALTLEKAGYRVEQAKDGQQALELLSSALSVQAIICDIEMPRLDGYGVLAKVKADPAISHLPIAMLTSRSGEKHRKLAMDLGASAYFSKPYNEQELLTQLETMMTAA